MKCLLRKTRINRWLNRPPSLSEEDIQELLQEIRPDENRLSVFLIENDAGVEAAVTGLASTRDSVSKIEFILIDVRELKMAGIHVEKTRGETFDSRANMLHRDILIASDDDLLQLVTLMNKGTKVVSPKEQITQWLKKAYKEGRLETEGMHHNLHKKIGIICSCRE